MSIGLHRFLCFAPPPNTNFSGEESLVFTKIQKMRTPDTRLRAASISGSGAEYSESLIGKKKQKRRSVAGIDQDELLDPAMLAEPDSYFCEFKGVQLHHKICQEDEHMDSSFQDRASSQLPGRSIKIGFPIILLHGFGASVFSWNRVMKPLAWLVGTKVLAFDRPAFGLTSRVNSLGHLTSNSEDSAPIYPYSMAFSVLATLSFINLLAAEKAILVGHSAGCLVAVNTYFEAPERVAALILVAPAIVAPLIKHKETGESQMTSESQIGDGSLNSSDQDNLFLKIRKILSKFYKYIARATMQMVKGMVDMVSSLYRKVLSAILRSTVALMLVRMIMDKFGIPAVRNAWYDANQVTDHVLQGYTKPLRVKDWDKALLEYTVAMLTDSSSESKKPPLARRLHEISCPVLIVTGDNDRIVPSWNAKRLSLAIPGSSLEVIKNCGHLPHEEKVEEFLSVVEKFFRGLFGAPQEQLLQATA
ncbi:alpha/beta-Hydrolases superfamily protein [Tasmannia lanceolata]|uniref:alpha/beta-Hydrolases superfamily protein n=1 Tax=Tasmannia lanceolata TaxID=3420 RepID=UPI00406308EC